MQSTKGPPSTLTELDVALHRQQDVVGLDIAVNDTLGVKMLQSLQGLSADRRNLSLGHDVERDNVSKASSLHILHDHPELSSAKVAVNEVDNVGVGALLHDQDFVDNQVLLGLLLQVHLLDGNQPVAASLVSSKHPTRGTLTDL
jgi:hypothetical protein